MDGLLAAQICLRDAWPAIETAGLGGWQLRAGRGGYNRTNSVWPGAFTGELPVENAIDRVEAFYRAHGLTPRFQMLGIASPSDLDARLAGRGYERDLDCSDLWKPVVPVAMPSGVSVAEEPTADWIGLYETGQPPAKAMEYREILKRLPQPHGFVVCRTNDRPSCVALVGRVGDDVAVDCVLTAPQNRRAGAARAVMTGAEAWAAGQGARRLLLSVVDDNTAAGNLYGSLGYRLLSRYHYRFRQGPA